MGLHTYDKRFAKLSAIAISDLIYNSINARTLILASTSALDKWAVMTGFTHITLKHSVYDKSDHCLPGQNGRLVKFEVTEDKISKSSSFYDFSL